MKGILKHNLAANPVWFLQQSFMVLLSSTVADASLRLPLHSAPQRLPFCSPSSGSLQDPHGPGL